MLNKSERKRECTMSRQDEIERVAMRLHSAAIHLIRSLRSEDRVLGLPPARLSALSIIVFVGPQSLHSLCKAEQVQPPTMSKLIDSLVEEKLVSRRPDPNDRRGIVISPTEKGRRLILKGRERRVKKLVSLIGKLGATDLHALDTAAGLLAELLITSSALSRSER
jgi:DNA-binding MarR family transcriptional regulator